MSASVGLYSIRAWLVLVEKCSQSASAESILDLKVLLEAVLSENSYPPYIKEVVDLLGRVSHDPSLVLDLHSLVLETLRNNPAA